MARKKSRKRKRLLTLDLLELYKTIRKPIPPGTRIMVDRRKYTRKRKHKKHWNDER